MTSLESFPDRSASDNPREGYHFDPQTVEAIKRHLNAKPKLPELSPAEAIAQARAALEEIERRRFPDS